MKMSTGDRSTGTILSGQNVDTMPDHTISVIINGKLVHECHWFVDRMVGSVVEILVDGRPQSVITVMRGDLS